MVGHKACLILGALLLISFGVSDVVTAGCKGCFGDDLIYFTAKFEEKIMCWFDGGNDYMLGLKLQLIDAVNEELTKLVNSSNLKSQAKCRLAIDTVPCNFKQKGNQSDCLLGNTFNLVQTYSEMEHCNGGVLDAKQLDAVFMVVFAEMYSWKHIHTDCYLS